MSHKATRREFLGAAAGLTGAAATWRYTALASAAPANPFAAHGVASGDPLADRVIIWTRVVTDDAVSWEVATDPSFATVVRRGTTVTSAAHDYTVHVDVDGLAPYTAYWYRFGVGGETSPVGRTRTLPRAADSIDRVRFGVVTCSEWEFGFFGGYRALAERDDLDAVLALGDYIYEFDRSYGGVPSPQPGGRVHEPAHELVSLEDYRTRYRQYRSDAGLVALHASHPTIVIYDDHEVCNDWWKDGGEAHDPATQGDFHERSRVARQAFREWMPIRLNPTDAERVYRRFQFGDLVDLFMLDERLYRDAPPSSAAFSYGSVDPAVDDPSRSMLGPTQRGWLLEGLETSPAAWKVLGNQVSVMPIDIGPALAGVLSTALSGLGTPLPPIPPPLLIDGWDGYNAERQQILTTIQDRGVKDVVVLTGDYHESFVSELPVDRSTYELDGNSAAVEFIAPAITSPTLTETLQMASLPEALTINTVFEANLLVSNPWVKFHDGFRNGFGVAEFRRDGMQYDFWFVDDRARPDTGAVAGAFWQVTRGAAKATVAAAALGPRPVFGNRPGNQAPAAIPATGGNQVAALGAAAAAVAALVATRLTKPDPPPAAD